MATTHPAFSLSLEMGIFATAYILSSRLMFVLSSLLGKNMSGEVDSKAKWLKTQMIKYFSQVNKLLSRFSHSQKEKLGEWDGYFISDGCLVAQLYSHPCVNQAKRISTTEVGCWGSAVIYKKELDTQ